MLFIDQHKLAMLISADQQETALGVVTIAIAFIENKLQPMPMLQISSFSQYATRS